MTAEDGERGGGKWTLATN